MKAKMLVYVTLLLLVTSPHFVSAKCGIADGREGVPEIAAQAPDTALRGGLAAHFGGANSSFFRESEGGRFGKIHCNGARGDDDQCDQDFYCDCYIGGCYCQPCGGAF